MSSQIKVNINYTAKASKYYYMYTNNIVALGKLKQGKNTISINLPNTNILNGTNINVLSYQTKNANTLMSHLRNQELENVSIENDTITGTTNYKDSGYTLFSLAYSKNWHAYIDGKEVKTLNPYNTNLMIKTPAGKHKITLKFIPYQLRMCQLITLGFWIFCIFLFLLQRSGIIQSIFYKKQKSE